MVFIWLEINLFLVTGLFLYPLETAENHWFSDVFREYRKELVIWNGLKRPDMHGFKDLIFYNDKKMYLFLRHFSYSIYVSYSSYNFVRLKILIDSLHVAKVVFIS